MKFLKLSNTNKRAMVDSEDYPWISEYRWQLGSNGFIRSCMWVAGRRFKLMLHRVVTNCPDGFEVDHKNHNRLDNRKQNLRIATRSQNQQNRYKLKTRKCWSIHKGVSFCKNRYGKKWVAHIIKDGKDTFLGWFWNDTDAANSYNKAAVRLFGEFALLNKV
jgi:hypothetical protein